MSFVNEPIASHMPILEMDRVEIRRFQPDDLKELHRILDIDLGWGESTEHRKSRMDFHIEQTSSMNPPFGYRAIVLKESGALIGMAGLLSHYLNARQRRLFEERLHDDEPAFNVLVTALGYALQSRSQGHGYATEAVHALIEFAFQDLVIPEIWAMTDHENDRSIALMQRIGMRIGVNPQSDAYPGVLGVLESRRESFAP